MLEPRPEQVRWSLSCDFPGSERPAADAGLTRRGFLGGAAAGAALTAMSASPAAASEGLPNKKADLHWLNITAERMPRVIEEVRGVCVVPWGCLERHGPHLPVGTDTIIAGAVAARAAQIEPAVVFPPLFYGQIAEVRHYAGTISLDHDLLLRLMRATLDEIGRNGLTKIVIANFHGGNSALVDYLLISLLQERRPYVVYAARLGLSEEDRAKWQRMAPSPGGHAGDLETSCILHLRPETVHLEDLKDAAGGRPRGALGHLGGIKNSFWWYADYPTQLAGDARPATAEKGKFYVEACAKDLARQIQKIKADDASPRLAKEFYDAVDRVAPPKRRGP